MRACISGWKKKHFCNDISARKILFLHDEHQLDGRKTPNLPENPSHAAVSTSDRQKTPASGWANLAGRIAASHKLPSLAAYYASRLEAYADGLECGRQAPVNKFVLPAEGTELMEPACPWRAARPIQNLRPRNITLRQKITPAQRRLFGAICKKASALGRIHFPAFRIAAKSFPGRVRHVNQLEARSARLPPSFHSQALPGHPRAINRLGAATALIEVLRMGENGCATVGGHILHYFDRPMDSWARRCVPSAACGHAGKRRTPAIRALAVPDDRASLAAS